MSIIKDDPFDYQAFGKTNPPPADKIRRGTNAREHRFESARMRTAVRIEEDILEHFLQSVPPGYSCEKAINQALREWLAVKNVKDLFRAELQQTVQQAFASIQISGDDLRPKKLEKGVKVE